MDHTDHVNLLRPADLSPGGTWADLGAGSGAFTLALRELIGPEAEIYAVDKDGGRLRELERAYHARFGDTSRLHILPADFSRPLDLPPLDGVLMANSLHFFREKETVLRHVRTLLKPGGTFLPPHPSRVLRDGDALLLLVEYNVDRGNFWVPHPLSFEAFRGLALRAGFSEPRLLARHPSRFLREFYSAVATG